ncbi:endonuclease/exonuclease/phosphatase family protein [Sphingomonas sp. SORGH_AS_0879]|uniref:endonuclease/exonuclease/phosphatase family protein n=1 Tax=Sphingomonas sp. SORGH_AS_0879 TaxID=3041790 RepID=UPI00278578C4|nr:endonuclease/exonuclease/phosphatase family protein [Sphingomonas sp. SORGH_AS_0879]MDQ1230674.1 vancomycin resistance protein VanJ [Sphingomonas sp. SORGH_AS_0879]
MKRLALMAGWMLLALAWGLALCPVVGRVWPLVDAFASFLPLALVPLVAALAISPHRRRAVFLAPAAGALLLIAWPIVSAVSERPSVGTIPAGATRIVLVTHNLHGGRTSPDRAARVLIESGADVLLLQEATGAEPLFARLSRVFPYRSACRGCQLAILSRLPMGPVRWRLPARGGGLVGPALFRAEVPLDRVGTLTVATVHAPWPFPPGPQARFRSSLIDAVRQGASDHLVLTGDFNLTPWGRGMAMLDQGLRPMTRVTRTLFSFPARVGGRDWPLPLLPIDQIFVGRGVIAGRVDTLPHTGSDHRAVRAELYVLPDPA